MGVMMTREQIRYDHGPSFILPFNPNPFDTAGRTKNIVDDPVIPKTVHISAISAYHLGVFRGGIVLGAKNRSRKVVFLVDDDDDDNGGLLVMGCLMEFGDDGVFLLLLLLLHLDQ